MAYASARHTRRKFLWFATAAVCVAAVRPGAADTLKEDEFKGTRAANWELRGLDGKTYRLSNYIGKAVLLNFWATWCAPCRVETKWLGEIDQEFRPQGLQVLGASMNEPTDDALVAEFAGKHSVAYPLLLRGDTIAPSYGGVRYLPQTFFIDRTGKIVRNTLGIKHQAELRTEAANLIR